MAEHTQERGVDLAKAALGEFVFAQLNAGAFADRSLLGANLTGFDRLAAVC